MGEIREAEEKGMIIVLVEDGCESGVPISLPGYRYGVMSGFCNILHAWFP